MSFELIKRYWQVCLFNEKPENTPYSPVLLGVVAFIYYVLNVLQWSLLDADQLFSFQMSLLVGATFIASDAIYTWALLVVSGKSNRMVQSLTCLLAGHALVHVCAFPLLIIAPWLFDSQLIQPIAWFIGIIYLLVTLGLTIWQFMVTVYIYKHALAIDYLPATLAGFGLLACNILMVSFWR